MNKNDTDEGVSGVLLRDRIKIFFHERENELLKKLHIVVEELTQEGSYLYTQKLKIKSSGLLKVTHYVTVFALFLRNVAFCKIRCA